MRALDLGGSILPLPQRPLRPHVGLPGKCLPPCSSPAIRPLHCALSSPTFQVSIQSLRSLRELLFSLPSWPDSMMLTPVLFPQELYRWPKVAEAARYALGIRYSLLPYLYTSFRNTASHGCPLARALLLGWPWDPLATGVDRQWTMGDAVLVTPVMEEVCCCLPSQEMVSSSECKSPVRAITKQAHALP